MEQKFKVGDIVITKPGYTNKCNGGIDSTSGGSGYMKNFEFEIKKVTKSQYDKYIAWPEKGSGIYFQALELYSESTRQSNEPRYEVY